jgi:hypothetical protein
MAVSRHLARARITWILADSVDQAELKKMDSGIGAGMVLEDFMLSVDVFF